MVLQYKKTSKTAVKLIKAYVDIFLKEATEIKVQLTWYLDGA